MCVFVFSYIYLTCVLVAATKSKKKRGNFSTHISSHHTTYVNTQALGFGYSVTIAVVDTSYSSIVFFYPL